jgi:hypothetical protein
VLAPRPEAFLAFLVPTGLIPAIRLVVDGSEMHFAMALLATVFTLATLITTWRVYRTIDLSLKLQSENQDLVERLHSKRNWCAGRYRQCRFHYRSISIPVARTSFFADLFLALGCLEKRDFKIQVFESNRTGAKLNVEPSSHTRQLSVWAPDSDIIYEYLVPRFERDFAVGVCGLKR